MAESSPGVQARSPASHRVGRLWRRIARLWDPIQLALWLEKHREQRGLHAFLVQQAAIFLLTFRRLRDDEITRRAAALTYFTLLSLVPVLAVAFALFKAFGGLRAVENRLRGFIIDNLAVTNREQIAGWLDEFIANINAGAIAGAGVLILFYSAIGLLTNVEKSFNRIWGIRQLRPLHLRFAIYWCMITLAPPLFGVSLSLSAKLQSSAFAGAVVQWLPFGIGRWLLSLAASAAVSLALILLYLIVPNTRVRLIPAVLGGVVAGILWSIVKGLFIWLSASSAKYSAIYGALSALPLLIIWLYYSWLITLFGATFTFANQTIASQSLSADGLTLTPATRERLAARLVLWITQAHRAGDAPPTTEALVQRAAVAASPVRDLLRQLVAEGVLRRVVGDQSGYVPARDSHQQTMADVVTALRTSGGTPLSLAGQPADGVDSLLNRANDAEREVLAEASLSQLAESASSDPRASQPAE